MGSVSYLERHEPRFHAFWVSSVDHSDPQHERWLELEGEQLAEGKTHVETIARFFPVDGRDVLDIGCQWGATCVALARAGARASGIDIEDDFIEGAGIRAAEQGVEIDLRTGVGEALPYLDASFDLVVLHNVIEHVRSHRETIGEIVRILRPGGGLWLTGPNRLSPQLLLRDPHYSMLGISVLPAKLGEFYVTRVRRYPSWTVGTFPIASRLERMLVERGMEIVGSSRLDASTRSARERRLNRLSSSMLFNLRRYFFIAARRVPASS
jgi:2-polyprenyl-3-methyl-5-hydroxy-6-metoxy-1,4-benzoquinol methylase